MDPPLGGAAATVAAPHRAARSPLRAVGLPAEHGGWGLTIEPGLLGLLLVPSAAGLCLALAAVVAFLARTPLKVVAVDRRRGRVHDRTRLALRLAALELTALVLLLGGGVVLGAPGFWLPALAAAGLFAVEGWYEVRSHGRRLAPELAGAIGVASVAAMVVLAGGGSGWLAAGAWALLAARVSTSIPFVRGQIRRLHGRPPRENLTAAGDGAAIAFACSAVAAHHDLAAGAVAVLAVIGLQRLSARGPVPRAVVLGVRQMAFGFGVVVVAALGVLVASA